MSDEIVWEEPPVEALRQVQRGRYAAFATALRERPKEWAVLPGSSTSEPGAKNTAGNIRAGKVNGFMPRGAFEAVANGTKIYVRFVGGPEEEGVGTERDSGVDRDSGRGAMIRSWARQNGHDVRDRGTLPREVVEAYEQAHAQHD